MYSLILICFSKSLPPFLLNLGICLSVTNGSWHEFFSLLGPLFLFLDFFLHTHNDIIDVFSFRREGKLLVVCPALFGRSHWNKLRKFTENPLGTAYKLIVELVHIFLQKLEINNIFLGRPSSTRLKPFSD